MFGMTTTTAEILAEGRDEAIVELASQFSFNHLPADLRPISESCHALAAEMIHDIPDTPQLIWGLQKLLEAKDCFVRAKNRTLILERTKFADEQAEIGHAHRKESIVEHERRMTRVSPENPMGVELPAHEDLPRDAGLDS